MSSNQLSGPRRREILASTFAAVGLSALEPRPAAAHLESKRDAPVGPKEKLKITKLETILVKPRWLFLKIHTDAGIVGLGEPIIEGRALTCAQAVKEVEPYLVGKDPRPVAKHWASDLSSCILSGRPDSDKCAQRH